MHIIDPNNNTFICTMCNLVVDIDALEDTPSMVELTISGLCMPCQDSIYDPMEAMAPCCSLHEAMGYKDPECVEFILAQTGIEYEPTSAKERNIEALECEGHYWEYFGTDEPWSLKIVTEAAHRKCHYTDPCRNKG